MTSSARKGTTTSHAATCRSPEKNSSFAAPMVASAYTSSRIRVPTVPDARNRSKGATPNTNQPRTMITYPATATAAVDRAGTPLREETAPSGAGPTSSRESANNSRAAPTTHASAQPKALTAAPMVMSSPTHPATNWLPRSPSSEPEAMKSSMPLASAPKPITSMAVTNMKYRPPKMATPRIARGMSRRGSCASSPSVAAASNPAKERKPNTTEEHRREARPARHREHREVQGVAVRGRARREPHEDDDADYQDQGHRRGLDDQQYPGPLPDVRGRQRPHASEGHRADGIRRPSRLVRPDAEAVQKVRAEDPGRRGGYHPVEGVGPHERPPGDDARPWSQRSADEPVDAAGVVEALGQPDKGPSDKEHTYRRQRERERDSPPDGARGPLRIYVGCHRGRHEGERDADGLPQM